MLQLINQKFRALYTAYNDIEKAFQELSKRYNLEDYTYRLNPNKSWSVYIISSEITHIVDDCTRLFEIFNVKISSPRMLITFIEQLITENICSGLDPYKAFKFVQEEFNLTSIRFSLSESEIIPTVTPIEAELSSPPPPFFQLI